MWFNFLAHVWLVLLINSVLIGVFLHNRQSDYQDKDNIGYKH